MKLLRLEETSDHCWVRYTENSIDWADDDDIIIELARPHIEDIQIRFVFEEELIKKDGALFQRLYYDGGTDKQMKEAFERLWHLGREMK